MGDMDRLSEEDEEAEDIKNDIDKIQKNAERKSVISGFCITCNEKIEGRALKTKHGLLHRKCHVCIECNTFLLGKKYGILFEDDGKKIKLCEKCTEEAHED